MTTWIFSIVFLCQKIEKAALSFCRGQHGTIPGGAMSFSALAEWRNFIQGLGLHSRLPMIVTTKFQRAQKLYCLAWIDFNLIKAGELVALITLELALKNHYGLKVRHTKGCTLFHDLLKHMVEQDGLTDEELPMYQKYAGRIVPNLYETDARKHLRGFACRVLALTRQMYAQCMHKASLIVKFFNFIR